MDCNGKITKFRILSEEDLDMIDLVISVPKWPVKIRARPSRRAFVENCASNACIFVILPVYL